MTIVMAVRIPRPIDSKDVPAQIQNELELAVNTIVAKGNAHATKAAAAPKTNRADDGAEWIPRHARCQLIFCISHAQRAN